MRENSWSQVNVTVVPLTPVRCTAVPVASVPGDSVNVYFGAQTGYSVVSVSMVILFVVPSSLHPRFEPSVPIVQPTIVSPLNKDVMASWPYFDGVQYNGNVSPYLASPYDAVLSPLPNVTEYVFSTHSVLSAFGWCPALHSVT